MAVMFVISYNVTLLDRATPNSVDPERKNGKRKWWEVYGEKEEEKDVEERNLPKNTKGLVITKIANDSPVNYLNIGNIIVEAQKKPIKSAEDLEIAVDAAIKSKEKTLLIVIYNNNNQRRYIGVKLE